MKGIAGRRTTTPSDIVTSYVKLTRQGVEDHASDDGSECPADCAAATHASAANMTARIRVECIRTSSQVKKNGYKSATLAAFNSRLTMGTHFRLRVLSAVELLALGRRHVLHVCHVSRGRKAVQRTPRTAARVRLAPGQEENYSRITTKKDYAISHQGIRESLLFRLKRAS